MGTRGAQTRKGYVMDVTFYKCNHCGNVAVKPFDKKVPLSCCGEKMTELIANSTDAAVEKHVPVVSVSGNAVHVEVGSVCSQAVFGTFFRRLGAGYVDVFRFF